MTAPYRTASFHTTVSPFHVVVIGGAPGAGSPARS